MEILVKVAQLILSLSILVLIHEFGHFFFAKLFKTRVEKFYLFFNAGFSIFKFKKGETEYGMGWIPLGGYVKIAGMIDESMDKEQMKKPPQPDEFRSKKSWQRLLIMVGGVMFNLILAIIIYTFILFVWGKQYLPTENAKYGIMCDSLAKDIGLRNGDKILSLDNNKVENFLEITNKIILEEVKTIQVLRNDSNKEIILPEDIITKLVANLKEKKNFIFPRVPFIADEIVKDSAGYKAGIQENDKIIGLNDLQIDYFDQFKDSLVNYKEQKVLITVLRNNDTIQLNTLIPKTGLINVSHQKLSIFFEFRKIEYTFLQSIPAGINEGISQIRGYLQQLKLVLNFKTKAHESVGSFFAIGDLFPGAWNWYDFWQLTAILSIMLGVINLLPIPALDGGHTMFLLYEMITRRKPSDKFMEYAQIVGFVIVLSLVAYALKNDIVNKFF